MIEKFELSYTPEGDLDSGLEALDATIIQTVYRFISELPLMPAGRPRQYVSPGEARRAASRRAAARARDTGLLQRSIVLPIGCWSLIRALRAAEETSDAQTLGRLLTDVGRPIPAARPLAPTDVPVR